MTEEEWLACDDPGMMLDVLQGKASHRKLRLFACDCCRRMWRLLGDQRTRRAIEVSEDFADGLASEGDLRAGEEAAIAAAQEVSTQPEELAAGLDREVAAVAVAFAALEKS